MENKADRTRNQAIVLKIFEDLAKDGEMTITDLVKSTQYHHKTILGYLELIEYIQNQPRLLLKRTGHSYLASVEKSEPTRKHGDDP
jgi:hypothetical protein